MPEQSSQLATVVKCLLCSRHGVFMFTNQYLYLNESRRKYLLLKRKIEAWGECVQLSRSHRVNGSCSLVFLVETEQTVSSSLIPVAHGAYDRKGGVHQRRTGELMR